MKPTNGSFIKIVFKRGSIKSQIGQPQFFQNWRRTLGFIIFGGLVIGGRDYSHSWPRDPSRSQSVSWLGALDLTKVHICIDLPKSWWCIWIWACHRPSSPPPRCVFVYICFSLFTIEQLYTYLWYVYIYIYHIDRCECPHHLRRPLAMGHRLVLTQNTEDWGNLRRRFEIYADKSGAHGFGPYFAIFGWFFGYFVVVFTGLVYGKLCQIQILWNWFFSGIELKSRFGRYGRYAAMIS